MKLQLFVNGSLVCEEELEMLNFSGINHHENCDSRKDYVIIMAKKMKNQYAKYIEVREWKIFLLAESKVNLINEVE